MAKLPVGADITKLGGGIYESEEECIYCHSRKTAVIIHPPIRQWKCGVCQQFFVPGGFCSECGQPLPQ